MGVRRENNRHGQTLVLFILFLLALVGILALTLDLGFVLLSRRTMQTAVNTGALEGARDIEGNGRQAARDVIRNVFDDDLDPTENLTTLGAGPNQSLVQRDANDRARLGQGTGIVDLWANRNQYIYRPNPQLNGENEQHGDLVAGDYLDTADSHDEFGDYLRDDFAASDNGQAFLARIRRTPERDSVANPLDRVENVSSSGTGSPLLIGHLMPFIPNPTDGYDIRRDGVTVRATAIANQVAIVTVYKEAAGTEALIRTLAPFARRARFDTSTNQPIPLLPGEDEWFEFDLDSSYQGDPQRLSVGSQLLDLIDLDTKPINAVEDFYYPIIDQDDRVVGFAFEQPLSSKRPNASPRLRDAWPILGELSEPLQATVLARHRNLVAEADPALSHAPALVRSTK
ncbi:MAG: TadE/TadG family type IV pilus assembly protein [Rubripirellula sp.]